MQPGHSIHNLQLSIQPMSNESAQHTTIAPEVPELITLFIGVGGHWISDADNAVNTVITLVSERFPSFTVTDGIGFFRGEREKVLLVHIATSTPQEVAEVAGLIRIALKQEGVGIGYRGRYLRAIEGFIPQLD